MTARWVVAALLGVMACGRTATAPDPPVEPGDQATAQLAGVDAAAAAVLPPDARAPASTFGPEAPSQPAPSKQLTRGIGLYDRGDYFSAHIELFKVVSKETSDAEVNRQRAEFFMAKAMYQLKIYAASLGYFERIIQAGDSHKYFMASVKWIVAIARFAPFANHNLPETLNIADPIYDSATRDEIRLGMARRAMQNGGFKRVVELAGKVAPNSQHYDAAQLLLWEAAWRTRDAVAASAALGRVVAGGALEPKAKLELARHHWGLGRRTEAEAAYRASLAAGSSVVGSREHVAATFELSLLVLDPRRRIPVLSSMPRPYLQTMVYALFCAKNRIGPRVFRPLHRDPYDVKKDVRAVLRAFEDNADLFDYVSTKLASDKQRSKLTRALVALVLAEQPMQDFVGWQSELRNELAIVGAGDPAWQTTEAANEVLQELTLQDALATADAGRLVRERLALALQNFEAIAIAVKKSRRRVATLLSPGKGLHVLQAGCP